MSSRGGARNRSGPAPDPSSGRSDRRGLSFQALPNEGYRGDVPEFPLPDASEREVDLWEQAWRTPQAAAWALEAWRWQVLAEYCRLVALNESDPKAALIAQMIRYRDQLGLTPAGMRENGWAIAQADIAPVSDSDGPKRQPSSRDRMRARVSGG